MPISDAEIAVMPPQERRDLIMRLARDAAAAVGPPQRRRRMRRRRLALTMAAPVVLVPWIVYLASSLPDRYVARHWAAAWVGFDVFLVVLFALTAVLGLLRRQLVVLTAFGTGLLLLCDAWFDVLTANPEDRWASVASAIFVELPVAVILITWALRLMRVSAIRLWLLEPGQPAWAAPLPINAPAPEVTRQP